MNKSIKRINKISKILMMLVLLVLSTSCMSRVHAGIDMNFEILSGPANPYWYCCEHGGPMPSGNSTSSYYSDGGSPLNDTNDAGTLVDGGRHSLIGGHSDGEVSESTYYSLNGYTYETVRITPFENVTTDNRRISICKCFRNIYSS